MCGEEAALAQDLNTRLQAKNATAEDFITAGWLSQRANDHAEVVAHLAQALQRTTDANAKSPIENALLYHAQRLVQKEQVGFVQQRPRNRHFLLHPFGKTTDRFLAFIP